VTHFVEQYGLWVVFVVVFLEVAGLPFLPGEAALIAAAALAGRPGHGSIVAIVTLAVAAAVLGALVGYFVGHHWGRGILSRWSWLERVTRKPLDRSQKFFDDHGGKAVFLGRFVPIVRATLGWMAGVGRMSFWRFLAWNVAGALAWGLGIGLLAYYVGAAVIDAIEHDLLIGVAAIAGIVLVLGGIHYLQKRNER
jgi:membrane protein DedA with SNARE-associated domain